MNEKDLINLDDCISRKLAIQAITSKLPKIIDKTYYKDILLDLPPVIEIVKAEDAAVVLGAQSLDSVYYWLKKIKELELLGFNICKIKGEEDGSC